LPNCFSIWLSASSIALFFSGAVSFSAMVYVSPERWDGVI
jgi:hypothetical protein